MPPVDTRFVEFQERRAALTSRPQPRPPSDAEGAPSSPAMEGQGNSWRPGHALVVPLTQARRELSAKKAILTVGP
jgi:hypothetical protein